MISTVWKWESQYQRNDLISKQKERSYKWIKIRREIKRECGRLAGKWRQKKVNGHQMTARESEWAVKEWAAKQCDLRRRISYPRCRIISWNICGVRLSVDDFCWLSVDEPKPISAHYYQQINPYWLSVWSETNSISPDWLFMLCFGITLSWNISCPRFHSGATASSVSGWPSHCISCTRSIDGKFCLTKDANLSVCVVYEDLCGSSTALEQSLSSS